LERFVQAADGRFGISHFILIDSLNFVFELIGATATYLALVDDPAWIRRAGDFAFELNVAIHDDFFDRVPLVRGGTCSNMVGWIPGRIVSESVDPFHMTSVDDFRRWGREPIERIFDHFDGGVLHIHGNGRHLLEAVCELPDLKAIFMLDDRGFPPAIDLIEQFRARAGDMPLVVQVDFATFCERLTQRTLPGGVYYRVKGPAEADAANRCMERVRSYRAADG